MPLKYTFKELFKGKFPKPLLLYGLLEDFQEQLDSKPVAKAIVKNDVKLNKTQLKKVFGDPSEFDCLGIVHNKEGSYLIVSNGEKYNFSTLEEL